MVAIFSCFIICLYFIFVDYPKRISQLTYSRCYKNIFKIFLVECVQSPPAFYAKRLNDSIAGIGTDDTALIRLIVSRSEIDLGTIKDEFERIYSRTLLSAVKVMLHYFQ